VASERQNKKEGPNKRMERDGGELLSLKLFQWPPPLMLIVGRTRHSAQDNTG